MISLVQTCLWLALIPLCISLLLDVCLGYPGAKDEEHVDSKAIFFDYSVLLARVRLISMGLFEDLRNNFKDNINNPDEVIRTVAREEYKRTIFLQARQYFTWEKGFGMCPVCTNVRVSIIFALLCVLLFGLSWYSVILITIFSNFFLLIFNKLKS